VAGCRNSNGDGGAVKKQLVMRKPYKQKLSVKATGL